ncbi:hypothetical protein SDJN03_01317, partial [Cucurbita argyrosperma subsp. sororia]
MIVFHLKCGILMTFQARSLEENERKQGDRGKAAANLLPFVRLFVRSLTQTAAIDLHRLGRPGVGCCADARVYKDLSCLLSWRAS